MRKFSFCRRGECGAVVVGDMQGIYSMSLTDVGCCCRLKVVVSNRVKLMRNLVVRFYGCCKHDTTIAIRMRRCVLLLLLLLLLFLLYNMSFDEYLMMNRFEILVATQKMLKKNLFRKNALIFHYFNYAYNLQLISEQLGSKYC